MRLKFLYFIVAIFSFSPFGLSAEMGETEDLNIKAAKIAFSVYETINSNVTFSEVPMTNSASWEVHRVIGKNTFFKKKGISLEAALDSLLEKASNTQFECGIAQAVYLWKLVLAIDPQIEVAIKTFEKDPLFQFPLILSGTLSAFEQYSLHYGFAMRDGMFTIEMSNGEKLPVNMKEEAAKIDALKRSYARLYVLNDLAIKPCENNFSAPNCGTCLGGLLYLPNVPGVKGAAKGENLVLVQQDPKLYYGFGPLFVNGPKTLREIGENLEKSIPSEFYKLTIEELASSQLVKLDDQLHHPLEYLIKPETCQALDFDIVTKRIKEFSSVDKSCANCSTPGKMQACSNCLTTYYCGRTCQISHWTKTHKHSCRGKK